MTGSSRLVVDLKYYLKNYKKKGRRKEAGREYYYALRIVLSGPGAMAQWNTSPFMHQDLVWTPVSVPADPLPCQLPACGLGK